jgi:hypothetical protein
VATPKRGFKGRRVGWSKLRASTRRRYLGAGITRADWEAGVDLRQARSHPAPPPTYQAPAQLVGGPLPSMADVYRVREWAESKAAPAWTRGMHPDTAAALSQIPWPPSQWRDVILTPAADMAPWTMRVVPKGRPTIGIVTDRAGKDHAVTAYDVIIQIPGGGELGSGARQVLDLLTFGPTAQEQEWEPVPFDLTGTE